MMVMAQIYDALCLIGVRLDPTCTICLIVGDMLISPSPTYSVQALGGSIEFGMPGNKLARVATSCELSVTSLGK